MALRTKAAVRGTAVVLGGLLVAAAVLWLLDVSLAALVPRTVTGWLIVGGIVALLVLWSRLVVPRLVRAPWLRATLRVIPVLALAAVVILPATIDREVSESLLEGVPTATAPAPSEPSPDAEEPAADEPVAGDGTPAGESTAAEEAPAAEETPEATAPVEPERLSTGAIRGVGHTAEGTASVYRAGGTDFVRLELDDVQGAVDVFVWLVPGAEQTTPDGGVNIGALKGTRGDANYVLPAGVDVGQYRTVLLWCRAFSTPIAVAPQS